MSAGTKSYSQVLSNSEAVNTKSPTRVGNAVPLSKLEVVFLAKGKRGAEITRLQFPLTLAWATTIHGYGYRVAMLPA